MRLAGRARVEFGILQGTPRRTHILVSSGSGLLDQAALEAVAAAIIPEVPESLSGRETTYQVNVVFDLVSVR
jgi:TonB family protein